MNCFGSFQNVCALRHKGFCALFPVIVLALLAGCATTLSEPQLSVDTRAGALSHFSLGLLADNNRDSAGAMHHFEQAVRLDPNEISLYGPLIATAIKLGDSETALHWADYLEKKYPEQKDALLLRANVYTLTDQQPKAELVFKAAIALFPEDPETHLYLVHYYLSRENTDAALQSLETAAALHPDNEELLHLAGVLYIEQASAAKDKEKRNQSILKAAVYLRKALEASADSSPERWEQLGHILLLAAQPRKALTAFHSAYSKKPDDLQLARQLLQLTCQLRPADEALDLFEQLAANTDTSAETWLQYLTENIPTEKRETLIRLLQEKTEQVPPPPSFYFTRLSALYLADKSNDKAEVILKKALALALENNRIHIVLGYMAMQRTQLDAAYSYLNKVRLQGPKEDWVNDPFFIYNFVISAQKCGHLPQAVEVLTASHSNMPAVLNQYVNALLSNQSPIQIEDGINLLNAFHEQSPESVEVLYYLSLLQAEQKNYDTALETARLFESEARQNNSTNLLTGFFYYQYGILNERTGQHSDAELLFEKSIEMGSEQLRASARNYIAYMWAERGEKLDKALTLIQEALKSEPENGAFIDTLGWVYYMQGQYADALKELQKAAELTGSDPSIWEHLGNTYFKLGDRKAALEYWKKALNISLEPAKLAERLKDFGVNLNELPAPATAAPEEMTPRP